MGKRKIENFVCTRCKKKFPNNKAKRFKGLNISKYCQDCFDVVQRETGGKGL